MLSPEADAPVVLIVALAKTVLGASIAIVAVNVVFAPPKKQLSFQILQVLQNQHHQDPLLLQD